MSADRRAQVMRFLMIGIAGTAAYLAVFVVLRTVLPAHPANIAARIGVAIPTTWLNGRHTFDTRAPWSRVVGGALVVLAVTTAMSSVFLAVEQWLAGPSDRTAEVTTLVLANAVAIFVRFQLLSRWLFRPAASPAAGEPTGAIA